MKPYLISRETSGEFRITVRTTRFNSQDYPLVSAEQLVPVFPTAAKARSYVREEHRAEAADIATASATGSLRPPRRIIRPDGP